MKEWDSFFLSLISNYVYRSKCGNRKSPFEKYHNNGYFTQELLVDAKISGWQYDEKQGIYTILKYLHRIYFLIINRIN